MMSCLLLDNATHKIMMFLLLKGWYYSVFISLLEIKSFLVDRLGFSSSFIPLLEIESYSNVCSYTHFCIFLQPFIL